jgi:hypothetical protein
VDQATVSRWERGLRAPEPRGRLQLSNLLRQAKLATQLSRETAMVEHSPYPMSIVSHDWVVIALSPPLNGGDAILNLEMEPRTHAKTTADMEFAMANLRDAGFFDGKINAARILAHGFLVGETPCMFAALCTPIVVRGEICRLSQYQYLTDAEFAKQRNEQGLLKILTPV